MSNRAKNSAAMIVYCSGVSMPKVLLYISMLFFTLNGIAQGNSSDLLVEKLAELPVISDNDKSLGYAGMYGGKISDVILAMGGANFPEGKPWEGGKKLWSDYIFLYKNGKWEISEVRLPQAMGYGASVPLDNGILCIGGNNGNGVSDKVFLVAVDTKSHKISIQPYPSLPVPLANLAAVRKGESIYVIGGNDDSKSYSSFFKLELGSSSWEKLEDMPGLGRSFHSVAIQESSFSEKLFVFGGRSMGMAKPTPLLSSYTAYDLKNKKWDSLNPIAIDGKRINLMANSSFAMGTMSILLFGGDTGTLFTRLENLDLKLNAAKDSMLYSSYKTEKERILTNHPGFSNLVYSFNTITSKWSVYDTIKNLPVTTLAFAHDDALYMVSGELKPGVRSPKFVKFKSQQSTEAFGLVNYIILGLYLLASVFIGLYFTNKQKSTDDYFKGGGRVPWWASGLSVFGTLLSALTFMAIPAKAFLTDWSYFLLNMAAILIVPVIAFYFIPYFNRLKINTAYEFLESRFNYTARALGSISFILFQIGRVGIILLLPSLAISIVTGIPVEVSIMIMGLLCMVYTAFGGIEAVIWTDVLQVIVLLFGSLLSIFWILFQGDISIGEAYDLGMKHQKFNIIDWDLDFTSATFWVVMLGGLASALITQGTDQTIVQRYLTSSSVKDAQKTLYTNAVLTLPATIIFFGIGTLLFVFYSKMPEKLPPDIQNNDSLFPWYIVHELPAGVSGLLIAGIFSGAMSSISSSLNSISTAFCNDFYQRIYPRTSDLKLLRIARLITILVGVIGVLFALWMANSNIKSLWDQFYKVLGLITGGLGGMFLLGIFTKKANAMGTLSGVIISAIAVWYASSFTNIHFLLYSFIGLVFSFIFGYLLSLLFQNKKVITN